MPTLKERIEALNARLRKQEEKDALKKTISDARKKLEALNNRGKRK